MKKNTPSSIFIFSMSLVASTAFGGSFYEEYKTFDRPAVKQQCTDEMFKKIPNGTVNGVFAVDLTEQSQSCVTRVLDNMSSKSQILFVESTNLPLRQTVLKAAKDLQDLTENEVTIALYKDNDPNDGVTRVSFWSDGHERGAYELEETYGVNEVVLKAKNSQQKLVGVGASVEEAKKLADKNQLILKK